MALGEMPLAAITDEEGRRLIQGQPTENRWAIAAPEAAAVDNTGRLVAILTLQDDGRLCPSKCFPPDA